MVNMWKRSASTEESAAAWINCEEGDKLRCVPNEHLRRGANEQHHAIGRGESGELVAEDMGSGKRLWGERWQGAAQPAVPCTAGAFELNCCVISHICQSTPEGSIRTFGTHCRRLAGQER